MEMARRAREPSMVSINVSTPRNERLTNINVPRTGGVNLAGFGKELMGFKKEESLKL